MLTWCGRGRLLRVILSSGREGIAHPSPSRIVFSEGFIQENEENAGEAGGGGVGEN